MAIYWKAAGNPENRYRCIIDLLSRPGGRPDYIGEESPSSIGQGAGQHPGGATLRKVQQKHTALVSLSKTNRGKGEMVRQELTGGRATGWPGKPHPEQGQIGGCEGARPYPRVGRMITTATS